MCEPNFLIIGAARSGTTALAAFLDQHPDVFLCSPKEPHFLAFAGEKVAFAGPGDDSTINRVAVTDAHQYRALFRRGGNRKAVGEGSVSTLYYHERAVGNIEKHLPAARLVVVLRNPIERAYSSFLYLTARGYEPLRSFDAALDAETQRIDQGWHHLWHYTRMGYYTQQLPSFLNAFGHDRVKTILFDDLRDSPAKVLQEVFEFLQVDCSFQPDTAREVNRSGVPRNRLLNHSIRFVNERPLLKRAAKAILPPKQRERLRNLNLRHPVLPQQSFRRLQALYRDEIAGLSDLLERDLSHWCEGVRAD